MTGMAARAMGYDVHVLDPDPACAARAIASRTVTAPYADVAAMEDFAARVQVVTLEIEQVPSASLAAAARHAPVHPSAEAVHTVQDRARQKGWLAAHGFPVGPMRVVTTAEECAVAVRALAPCIVKASMGGYDGRGQVRVRDPEGGAAAFASIGAPCCVVEQFLEIATEISVMTARRADGTMASFPPSLNHHDDGILTWSVAPAPIPEARAREAVAVAQGVTSTLGIVGLLAVELFITADGRLLVNETAPRPHNTFHQTERGASVSQFEQLVRAVCSLPLEVPTTLVPAAIHNLLGDCWADGEPDFTRAWAMPGVRVHLYGKPGARPGRKMGHLSAVAGTTDEARDLVRRAYRAVTSALPPR
ncbi:MAG: ATP-grasp domain-containing protein [Gemmatimonadetes bacterium]|nr:ATP-grasp domain-containing protein [Gemmatimonadota bacterium]